MAPCCCVVEDFSDSLVRLMMFLISSFCFLLWSLLLHHIGLLYSQVRPRCLQALHLGLPSSHFFLRNRHVKQPCKSVNIYARDYKGASCICAFSNVPERDLRCILEEVFVGDDLGAAMEADFVGGVADCADMSAVMRLNSSYKTTITDNK